MSVINSEYDCSLAAKNQKCNGCGKILSFPFVAWHGHVHVFFCAECCSKIKSGLYADFNTSRRYIRYQGQVDLGEDGMSRCDLDFCETQYLNRPSIKTALTYLGAICEHRLDKEIDVISFERRIYDVVGWLLDGQTGCVGD
jgi:hypothetical protein